MDFFKKLFGIKKEEKPADSLEKELFSINLDHLWEEAKEIRFFTMAIDESYYLNRDKEFLDFIKELRTKIRTYHYMLSNVTVKLNHYYKFDTLTQKELKDVYDSTYRRIITEGIRIRNYIYKHKHLFAKYKDENGNVIIHSLIRGKEGKYDLDLENRAHNITDNFELTVEEELPAE